MNYVIHFKTSTQNSLWMFYAQTEGTPSHKLQELVYELYIPFKLEEDVTTQS